jgi:hypothetical protein
MPMTLSVTNFDSGRQEGMCSFCGVDQLGYDVTVFWFDSITSSRKLLFCSCTRKWLVFVFSNTAREMIGIIQSAGQRSEP